LTTTIDNNFISFIEYKDTKLKFNRIDSDLSDVLKDESEVVISEDEKNKIIDIFKNVYGDKMKEYSVESLKNEETPVMILVSEYSRRMAEMQKQFGGNMGGMSFPEERTLVINEKNPIIKKLIDLSSNEDSKEKVQKICRQLVDLALIGTKSLNGDELSEFIKRSNELVMEFL
ncbi:MAG: molecular chaperone HtpG, partial [Clostridium sp.]|nr:molecular chaperone HtpG [Clostridium sp.]